jgi:hypothetical protein
MKAGRIRSKYFAILAGLAIILYGCSPLISKYDQYSYLETTSLKVEAMNMISMATDSVTRHLAEIDALGLRMEKICEYEKGKPYNTITAEQWKLLKSPDNNLCGGFIKEWRSKSVLKAAYVEDKKEQIGKAFDIIIDLETHKIKDRKIAQ